MACKNAAKEAVSSNIVIAASRQTHNPSLIPAAKVTSNNTTAVCITGTGSSMGYRADYQFR